MKFSSVSRLLSLCLAFGLLLGTCLPSAEAREVYKPTDEDIQLLLEDWEPYDDKDYTAGLNEWVQFMLPSTYGIVNDDTGSTSYSIRYYSGMGFNSWVSETNWSTSSDIQVNKIFTASNVRSGVGSASWAKFQRIAEDYYTPAIGYTISFMRADGDYLAKGSKIALNLVFDDTCPDGNFAEANFGSNNTSLSVSAISNSQMPNTYTNLGGSILDLSTGRNDLTKSIIGFDNVVTVGGVDLDGNEVIFETYSNKTNLVYDLNITEDVQYIWVDVCYDGKYLHKGSQQGSYGFNCFYIPLVYNFNLSGSVELDDSGIISGLIGGIIDWLRSILEAITELPNKIVDGIKTVLQELFVPSPEFIGGKFEEFKLLAESKLGFLFTMLDMVVELFTTLSTNISDPMETITIPSLALPFEYVDGGQLVLWDEMTFKVFPDGLDVLLNLVHLVTSIVIVTATINYAVYYVKRFFEKE